MAFSDFTVLSEVAKNYHIKIAEKQTLFEKVADVPLSDYFLEDIKFSLRLRKTNASKYFLCESLVFRTFLEVLKRNPTLNFWSHEYTLTASKELTGVPDYLISLKGKEENYEQLYLPFIAVGDAKKEDFAGGWAQTLAEMIACQKVNEPHTIPIYSIVTTGNVWEFACLDGNVFTQDVYSYSIGLNTHKIVAVLDYIFKEGEKFVQNSQI